jgi:hypothetical protein
MTPSPFAVHALLASAGFVLAQWLWIPLAALQIREMDDTLFVVHTDDLSTEPVLRIRTTAATKRTSQSTTLGIHGCTDVQILREVEAVLLHHMVRVRCLRITSLSGLHHLP